ncbi:MAG: hypothetical protein R3Y60_03420 [bacterium]
MSKSHRHKKSCAVLYIFYLLYEGKVLTITQLTNELRISRSTLYLYILDIEMFIAEYCLYHMELINEDGTYKLKKNRKVIDNYHFYFKVLISRKPT